jgi:dTDP-4-amino-4,6-dideoxygalactose transaminase
MLPLIPEYPTLGPKSFCNVRSSDDLPYPLNHDRIRYYYQGRNAVYAGAKALGISSGDGILFPAYHSGAEAAALLHLGCDLTYYAVDQSFRIDLDEIASKIGAQTKALYAIHFAGLPGPIEALRQLADRHGLLLIEDVALGFLSAIGDRPLGTWGDMSVFCLYKTLPLPNGGMLAINRNDVQLPPLPKRSDVYSELNQSAKHILNHVDLHGGTAGRWLRSITNGFCSHVVSALRFQAAAADSMEFDPCMLDWGMGTVARRMAHRFNFHQIAQRRRDNYQWLADRLTGTDIVAAGKTLTPGAVPLFFPIFADDKFATVERLRSLRIEAVPVWGIHHAHLPRGEFPETEFLVDHLIEVPIYQELTTDHLERIAVALEECAGDVAPRIGSHEEECESRDTVWAKTII